NGNYQIKISNKLDEKQYTDLTRLLVIEHPNTCRAYLDKYGKVMTTTHELVQAGSIDSDNKNYTQSLSEKDSSYYSFTDEPEGGEASSIIMTFDKPRDASRGKLIVSASNTIWADYLFNEFYH